MGGFFYIWGVFHCTQHSPDFQTCPWEIKDNVGLLQTSVHVVLFLSPLVQMSGKR